MDRGVLDDKDSPPIELCPQSACVFSLISINITRRKCVHIVNKNTCVKDIILKKKQQNLFKQVLQLLPHYHE